MRFPRSVILICAIGVLPALGVAQDSFPPGGLCQDRPVCEEGLVWDEITQTCIAPVSS